MSYKNFSLTFLFQGSEGNDIFNATRIKTEDPMLGYSATLNNRWTVDNQNTMIPAFTSSQARDEAKAYQGPVAGVYKTPGRNRQSRYIEDGSYARLKNVTLGFNLPKEWIQQMGISVFRLYVSGTNLWTLTKYTGFDPEISSFKKQGNYGASGIDLSGYPSQQTFSVGLNLTF